MSLSYLRIGYILAFLLTCVYALLTLRDSIPALAEKRQQIRVLEQQNAALARENQLRRERIERLADSPSEQELEIRKRWKLVDPRDKVFVLQDPGHSRVR